MLRVRFFGLALQRLADALARLLLAFLLFAFLHVARRFALAFRVVAGAGLVDFALSSARACGGGAVSYLLGCAAGVFSSACGS